MIDLQLRGYNGRSGAQCSPDHLGVLAKLCPRLEQLHLGLTWPESFLFLSRFSIYTVSTISTQYLHSIYTVSTISTPYLHSIYNLYAQYLQYLHSFLFLSRFRNISHLSVFRVASVENFDLPLMVLSVLHIIISPPLIKMQIRHSAVSW